MKSRNDRNIAKKKIGQKMNFEYKRMMSQDWLPFDKKRWREKLLDSTSWHDSVWLPTIYTGWMLSRVLWGYYHIVDEGRKAERVWLTAHTLYNNIITMFTDIKTVVSNIVIGCSFDKYQWKLFILKHKTIGNSHKEWNFD